MVIVTHLQVKENIALAWQKSQKQAGYDVELAAVDVTSFKSCAAMAQDIVDRFDHISILVNGAGITRDTPLRKMEESEWSSVLTTNLDSVFNVSVK